MSNITCGNCKLQHQSVADVKACYAGNAVAAVANSNPPSQKQIDLIEKLMAERDVSNFSGSTATAMLDKRLASALITYLLAAPRVATGTPITVPVGGTTAAPQTERQIMVTEGMYRMDGKVYRVQVGVHGSGRLYAKVLQGKTFEYERGAIFRLRPEHRMTLDDAAAFGRLYGQCCVCGRTLTDEVSIANGIGPVCAGKGWWDADDRERLAATPLPATATASADGPVTMSRAQYRAQFRSEHE